MTDETLDQKTISEIISVQKAEIQLKVAEIAVRSDDLSNHKEIALFSIKAQDRDREQSRATYERVSKRRQIYSGIMLVIVLCFIGFLVTEGYAENVFALLSEIFKYFLAFLGGSGMTVIYYNNKLKNDDTE